MTVRQGDTLPADEVRRFATEKQFMQAVIAYARAHGWKVHHTFDERGSEPGFPDLQMARDGVLLLIECKREVGRLTAAQAAWMRELEIVEMVDAVVWRPSDWDYIQQVLA